MISDLEIKLNDVSLSDYFDLTDEPDRGLFPEVQHDLVQMARANGSRATNKRFAHRIITLPLYALSGNFRQTKDDLANVLFAEGRQRLWFSDEPDRYWLVELTGESSWRRSLDSKGEAFGELKFLCEDGLAHAMFPKTFQIVPTSEGVLAEINNTGTYKTPIDINVTFTSDANSIGFVSSENVVQLGTPYSEDGEPLSPTEKIMNDDMGSASKNLWSQNTGRPRWRFDDGDHTSKVEGSLTWGPEEVYPASYGAWDPEAKAGYWHGPTVTRLLTDPLSDFEVFHRLEFKPTGNAKQKPTCQGLMEINYSDADNNFIVGFEMKDNTNVADAVTYSFFVGDYRIYEASLPKSVINYNGGFFGSIMMKKIGNEFTFKIARIDGSTWKETWSVTKSWFNETVAMLSASVINGYFAQWRDFRPMNARLTHTRITKYNIESATIIPKIFYEGDILKVEGKSNRVYINGFRDDSYRVVGSSQSFIAPKRETEIAIISDGTFTGNLEIEECYL